MAQETFFRAYDATHGTELWVTDGTAAGTTFLADIRPGTSSSNPANFAAIGQSVVFTANDGTHGAELWESDGTAAGTVLLDDIDPGSAASAPYGLTAIGSSVVFRANDGGHGSELWVTNGTSAGTKLLDDIAPGASGSYPTNFTQLGGKTIFHAKGNDGGGLWQTDGTVAGTKEIATIYPGAFATGSYPFTVAGGLAFSAGRTGQTLGTELLVTDGTAAGSKMVKDINPGNASSQPSEITAIGNKVVFRATDGTHGAELWVSDGTGAGTTMLKDINPGTASGYPQYLISIGNQVLFFANDGAAPTGSTKELWTTDGTASGTHFVADVVDGGKLAALNGKAYFKGNDGVHGDELWVSDGTAAGTGELKDLSPGPVGSYLYGLTVAGNHILFTASGGPNQPFGLWSTDGTASGTTEISTAATNPSNFYTVPACFAAGTRIRTAGGETLVEDLTIGEAVMTPQGAVPIGWIGRSRVDPASHPRPWDVHPVRILAGAFGHGLPARDLRLSPEHALFVDGALIPVRHLVNDTTIVQEACGPITYWHVELATHGVLYAEGLPAESYLDTGNRGSFDDATVPTLHADFARGADAAQACAPMVETGPALRRVRARLAARARRWGLVSRGVEVQALACGVIEATIPPGVTRVHVVSPSTVPAGERRRLGAAVARVAVDDIAQTLAECCTAGFHASEGDGDRWRWTNGRGVLVLAASPRSRRIAIDIVGRAPKSAAA